LSDGPGLPCPRPMSSKKEKIQTLAAGWTGRDRDARYLGYFECFNQGRFYEAHDVLEDLWLERRRAPEGDFYKALIQLAGAFVHLQKNRLQPAAALLHRAADLLGRYPPEMEGLRVPDLLALIGDWAGWLERSGFRINPLNQRHAPRLTLPAPAGPGARR